ncbi:MAG TPA: trypsin-like peptidase domain-containing protein [Planctomycetota bacterium]|nr:trypsin-like peptidase domain-containing protein [Planctomycetota bacterium]
MHRVVLFLLISVLAAAGCSRICPRRTEANASAGFREAVTHAKDQVFPAVVFIKCLRESHETGQRLSQEVAGSGVIISPEGEVLTNHHVVDKAAEIRCLLSDGRAMDAQVIGSDKDTDLALLQLDVPSDSGDQPCAKLGDSSELREGDFVMAMGAPWGLGRSVSIGIISCTRRFLPGHGEYSLWLQTDASISPGNSGGPLVNTSGEVVGINTLATMSGGDLGFTIPSETIRIILAQLREHGKMNWSWTGLQLQPLKDFNRNIYFDGADGVIVAGTDSESPARRAGITARDRITKVNGQAVDGLTEEDLPAIRRQLGLLPKYKPVAIELVRNDQPVTVELIPREKGDVEGAELDCPRWDFTVKVINQFDTPALYFYRKQGVFIYGVKRPGNAINAGLQQHDILLKINDKEVATLDDVKAIHKALLQKVDTEPRAVLSVMRNGLLRQFVLDFARDYEKK